MNWFYKDEIVSERPDKMFGFVYIITNLNSGMKYIGKKQFLSRKIKQIKGVKKKYLGESDWKTYLGSNKTLLSESGDCSFRKEILYFCKTKSEMSYIETLEILKTGALIRDDFYNDWVSCKITRRHLNGIKNDLYERIK